MMSIGKIKSSGAREVASYHLSMVEDYYVGSKGERAGEYGGALAETLGLAGRAPTDKDLSLLLEGFHPTATDENGDPLRLARHTVDRVGCFDLCFSADKSVSVYYGIADEQTRETIRLAHDAAVKEAMAYIEEKLSYTRLGVNGVDDAKTSGIIYARFEHTTSRGGDRGIDVDLHSHHLCANLAQTEDGRWRTINAKRLYEAQMAASMIYRGALARNLIRDANIPMEHYSHKNVEFVRIQGFSQELCDHFSQRKSQIEERLAEWKAELEGKRVEIKEQKLADRARLVTRSRKEKPDREALHAQWTERAAELGHTRESLAQDIEKAGKSKDEELVKNRITLSEGKSINLDAILSLATQNEAVIALSDIERAAAQYGLVNGIAFADMKAAIADIRKGNELIKLGRDNKRNVDLYTTREMIRLEHNLARQAVDRAGETFHRVDADIIAKAAAAFENEKGFHLTDQQRAALDYLCNTGGVACINGAAGSGKTSICELYKAAMEAQGARRGETITFVGCALAGKAAAGLEEVGVQSSTIHKLLIELDAGRLTLGKSSVVLMDEAGMTDTRLMARLQEHLNGAKIVYLGDIDQLTPVAAGHSYRVLQEKLQEATGTGAFALDEIRRQKQDWQMQAVHDLRASKAAEALAEYDRRGRVTLTDNRFSAIEATARAYVDSVTTTKSTKDNLMVAAVNDETYQMNFMARELLKQIDMIGRASEIIKTVNGEREFAIGDRMIFKKNSGKRDLDVKNGWLGTVTDIRNDRHGNVLLHVNCDNGEKRVVNTSVYKDIDWSYAISVHASQGVTVPRSFVLSGSSMESMELAYVSLSRHKLDTQIFADRESLREALQELPPNASMVDFAEDVAKRNAIELPDGYKDHFLICREFLNEHSGAAITHELSTNNPLSNELQSLAAAMSERAGKVAATDFFKNLTEEQQQAILDPTREIDAEVRLSLLSQEEQTRFRAELSELSAADKRTALRDILDRYQQLSDDERTAYISDKSRRLSTEISWEEKRALQEEARNATTHDILSGKPSEERKYFEDHLRERIAAWKSKPREERLAVLAVHGLERQRELAKEQEMERGR